MAVSIVATIFGAVSYGSSLVGEGWTRYFLLLAGLLVNNVIGGLTALLPNYNGLYIIEGVIGFVVANVFQIQGFFFPIYYGVSSLTVLFVIMPLVFFLIKMFVSR